MIEVPLNVVLAPELESITDLGTETNSTGFAVTVGTSPVCHQVSKIFATLGVELPPQYKLFDRFRLWLVPQNISLLRRSGLSEPVTVGIEVDYIADGATCSIVSLLPSPEFIKHGELSLGASVQGSMKVSGAFDPMATPPNLSGSKAPIAMNGLTFASGANGAAELSFSATVVTPFISAVGLDPLTPNGVLISTRRPCLDEIFKLGLFLRYRRGRRNLNIASDTT